MKVVDSHTHTDISSCSGMSPEQLARAAEKEGLDGLIVTNHGTTDGASEVREAADGLEVFTGAEVTTSEGDILAWFVDNCPEEGLNPVKTVELIHEKGGLACLAHPFDPLRNHFHHDEELLKKVDFVEAVNSRCILDRFNGRARRVANEFGLPVTGGSDAHFPSEVGRAYTVLPEDICEGLRTGQSSTEGNGRNLDGHLLTKLQMAGVIG